MINAQLLESTISHIRDFPELHAQSGFYSVNEFGVAACFAGRSLLLAGYEAALPLRLGATSSLAKHPTAGIVNVWDEARIVLGIGRLSAATLFSATNTRRDLEHYVKDILNGERCNDLVSV